MAVSPMVVKLKTRELALTIDTAGRPAAVMVMFCVTARVPLVRVIVCGVANRVGSKVTVPPDPAFACAMTPRNEPAPLSFRLVTVKVAAQAGCVVNGIRAIASRGARNQRSCTHAIRKDVAIDCLL